MAQTLTGQGAARWAALAEPGKDGRCCPEGHRPPCGDRLVGLTDPLTQPHCITVWGAGTAAHPSSQPPSSTHRFTAKGSARNRLPQASKVQELKHQIPLH